MEVFVRVQEEAVCIELLPHDTAYTAKEKAGAACGLDVDCFSLSWEGGVVPDHEVLADIGVAGGDTLEAVLTDKMLAQIELNDRGLKPTRESLKRALITVNEDLARLILRAGVGINDDALFPGSLWSHIIGSQPAIRLAAKLGANPNQYYTKPLLFCYTDLMQCNLATLLEVGADPNVRFEGVPLLMHAYPGTWDARGMLRTFVKHKCDINATDPKGRSLLLMCCGDKYYDLAVQDMLTSYKPDVTVVARCGRNALHYVVRRGDVRQVRRLLSEGVDVSQADNRGLTPLHLAALRHCRHAAGKLLVKHGADVNARCKIDQTPAHKAAYHGHADILYFLYTHGADMSVRDKKGRTPLHVACEQGQWKAAVRLTLQCGADPLAKLGDDNVLHIATKGGWGVLASFLRKRFGEQLSDARNEEEYVPLKKQLHWLRDHMEYARRHKLIHKG